MQKRAPQDYIIEEKCPLDATIRISEPWKILAKWVKALLSESEGSGLNPTSCSAGLRDPTLLQGSL